MAKSSNKNFAYFLKVTPPPVAPPLLHLPPVSTTRAESQDPHSVEQFESLCSFRMKLALTIVHTNKTKHNQNTNPHREGSKGPLPPPSDRHTDSPGNDGIDLDINSPASINHHDSAPPYVLPLAKSRA